MNEKGRRRGAQIAYPLVPLAIIRDRTEMIRGWVLAAPMTPGVYFLLDADGSCNYVGQTTCIALRLAAHQASRDFTHFAYLLAPRWQLVDLEIAYIRMLRPAGNTAYNIADDCPDEDIYKTSTRLQIGQK